MNRIVLSIGLNVGAAEPAFQLNDTLAALASAGIVRAVAMGSSTWEGVPERFIQVLLDVRAWPVSTACLLARMLNQDAIAIIDIASPPGHWTLCQCDYQTARGGSVADFPILARVAV